MDENFDDKAEEFADDVASGANEMANDVIDGTQEVLEDAQQAINE